MRFQNVTIYVTSDQVEPSAALYRDVLALAPAFAQPGHIGCFELQGFDLALCIHEADADHPAGTVELIFATDDAAEVAARATAHGHAVTSVGYADGHADPVLVDAAGTLVRLVEA